MNILLINTNPVVSRLISLCIREDETVLEEVTNTSSIQRDNYDIVFIDDLSYTEEAERALNVLQIRQKVLLLGNNSMDEHFESFDEVLRKPFLPSQIRSVIDALNSEEEEVDAPADEHFIFPLSIEVKDEDELLQTEEEKVEEDEIFEAENSESPEILDSEEISRIRSLLQENEEDEETIVPEEKDYEERKREVITEHLEADGLEIVSEDEIINILSKKTEKQKNKKKKKKRPKQSKEKEDTYTFEEALIAAVEGMKVKKIKKLLKNADVTINIKFKDKK
ncbi:MAG TPA: hypothetical protein EYG78_01600 [Sulfurovum sp.]|nr:hypothetical protein [Sulfurovum sp.]